MGCSERGRTLPPTQVISLLEPKLPGFDRAYRKDDFTTAPRFFEQRMSEEREAFEPVIGKRAKTKGEQNADGTTLQSGGGHSAGSGNGCFLRRTRRGWKRWEEYIGYTVSGDIRIVSGTKSTPILARKVAQRFIRLTHGII